MIDLQMQSGADVAGRLDRLAPRMAEELAGSMSRLGPQWARTIRQATENGADGMAASVSIAAPHASADEVGIGGIVSVRQRLRQVRQAFRRSISPDAFAVKPQPIRAPLPDPSFLRSALHEVEASGAIRAEISAGMRRATA